MNETLVLSDIHGQYHLLIDQLEQHYHQGYELVVLGDMFDRAIENGDSRVLNLLRGISASPGSYGFSKVTILRGNHEDMLINAIEKGPDSEAYFLWVCNGGDAAFYKEATAHLDWLKSLPYYYIKGDVLFVHAGVMPNVPLEDQRYSDLMWIREEFLNCEEHGLPYFIVHGHTPVDTVDIKDDRMNIDTGSFFSGNLSAVILS